MNIKYINNTNDDYLYSLFVGVYEIDYKDKEINEIDRLIIRDTIDNIDRLDLIACRRILSKIGSKGYYNLNKADTVELLKNELYNTKEDIVLEIYEDNKTKFGMFAYQIIELLNITKWRFGKIKERFLIAGEEVVNIAGKPKTIKKYDRRFIYEVLLKKNRKFRCKYMVKG